MSLEPTKIPLTVKEFDSQRVGFCAGCGCACGYILYQKDGRIVDLYGHPADPRGMGSFCTKGITYIQELISSPIRLKGIFVRKGEEYISVDYPQALETLKEKLSKGKTAFLLGRQAGLEDYLLAKSLSEDIFVDAPLVDFMPSTLKPTEWKRVKFILSVDAEPVFSEVMATRWVVDAVEAGAYLFCLSSRHETICAKAKERLLLKPDSMIEFLQALLEPNKGDSKVEFVKKSLFLMRGALVLVGTHLLNSPFREAILSILARLRRKFGINYSFVGDLMPFPAKSMEEFFERFEEFDNLIVVGNLFRYLKQEHLESLKDKFVVSFQIFPNITAHYSDILFALSMFQEREFVNYRHGFGYLVYSPRTVDTQGVYNPADVLGKALGLKISLKDFEHYRDLKERGELDISMEYIDSRNFPEDYQRQKGELFLYTDSMLVEELGHWNPWTHEMERFQRAYVNPHTARSKGLRDSIQIGNVSFELIHTNNVAEGVIFIPSEYEEFQPFDPGHRVGAFLKKPYYRYEVFVLETNH